MASLLTESESIRWQVEADPALRSDFTDVTVLDGSPDPAAVRGRLAVVVDAVLKLRQRVAPPPLRLGLPRWTEDPDFDLDHHVRHRRVPAPGGQRQLLDVAADLAVCPSNGSVPCGR